VAARWVQLDRDEELACVEPALEQGGRALVARPEGSAVSTRARRAGSTRAALRCGVRRSSASRIARMCCGVVPQQPPTSRAPLAIIRAA